MFTVLYPFATLSMELLVLSSLLVLYGRRLWAGIGFTAVGVGGVAITWSHWSASAGHANSLAAFTAPTAVARGDWYLLLTHAPFAVVGLLMIVSECRRLEETRSQT